MRTYLATLIACFSIALGAVSASAQTHHLIAVSPGLGLERGTEVVRSIARLALDADAGDELWVVNGLDAAPIAQIDVPDSPTDKARLNAVMPHVQRVAAFLRAANADPERPRPEHARLHVPRVIELVRERRGTRAETRTVRVLLFGQLYHDLGDPRHDTRPGFVPSDGHATADPAASIYGTAGREGSLEAVCIHWCTFEQTGDDLETHATVRFWSLWTALQGGTLSYVGTDPSLVTASVIDEDNEPVMRPAVDRDDLRLAIRPVILPDTDSAGIDTSWKIVLVIDTSASMTGAITQVRSALPALLEDLAGAGGEVRLGLQPYRDAPLDAYPITRVIAGGTGGAGDYDSPNAQDGLRSYLGWGLEPLSVKVDTAAGLRAGLNMLEEHPRPAARELLVLIGDAGLAEHTPGSELALAQAALMDRLRAWAGSDPRREVHAVDLSQGEPDALFVELAAIGGRALMRSVPALVERLTGDARPATDAVRTPSGPPAL